MQPARWSPDWAVMTDTARDSAHPPKTLKLLPVQLSVLQYEQGHVQLMVRPAHGQQQYIYMVLLRAQIDTAKVQLNNAISLVLFHHKNATSHCYWLACRATLPYLERNRYHHPMSLCDGAAFVQ